MEHKFKDFLGNDRSINLIEHPINDYEVLFHVSLKENRKSIEDNGIILNQNPYKALSKTGLTFFSYPIEMDTSDCFRWSDQYYTLYLLDVKKLVEDGIKFFDDPFSQNDQSSKRNHLCCNVNLDKKYIKKIYEW